jgi:hypothetical protein
VSRNAVEKKRLIKSDPEDISDPWSNPHGATFDTTRDDRVQPIAPSQHTINKFRGQRAVFRQKARPSLQSIPQRVFGEPPLAYVTQDVERHIPGLCY